MLICVCEPSIDGETADGGNSTQALSSVATNSMTGGVTVGNQGEFEACDMDDQVHVEVTSGTATPVDVRIGSYTFGLTPQGTPWPYSGSSSTKRHSIGCGGSQSGTVHVRDSAGNNLTSNTFVFRCLDCDAT